jgi:hypothetical protein
MGAAHCRGTLGHRKACRVLFKTLDAEQFRANRLVELRRSN